MKRATQELTTAEVRSKAVINFLPLSGGILVNSALPVPLFVSPVRGLDERDGGRT